MDGAIRHLTSFDRPSASDGERVAAQWIAARLGELGAPARVEVESAHGTYWWPLGLLNAVGLAGALLGRAGRLLSAAAAGAIVDDLEHRSRAFRRLFLPRRHTYNVVAEAGERDAERTVVVVAHHDAAHGGAVFDVRGMAALKRRFPRLYDRIDRWPPLMLGTVAGPLLVALGRRRAGAVFCAGTIAAMADIGRSPLAPGANDNLSAVAAVLALARRLRDEPVEGLRVLLVSTGAEESNSEGMQAFGRRHFSSLSRDTTSFIALECLGSGHVTIAESEGFLLRHGYDAALKDLATACAERLGIPVRRGLKVVFTSDAQIALHGGYRTMLLGGTDDLKLPANYHKLTDTADNIDLDALGASVDVLEATVRALAAQPSSERAAAIAS
jgi:acetylornithine deacetylase/succinyl-diaminopimelate desuccinylase-like protein